MAAGLTDHVWTLREVLLFRVPPWPQSIGLWANRGGKQPREVACAGGEVRPHGWLRGYHQGWEGRWEPMRSLSSRPFCPC